MSNNLDLQMPVVQLSPKKLVNILLHILFTAMVVIVPLYLMPMKHSEKPDFANIPLITFTFLQVIAFYVNAYMLHPKILLKGRVVSYIILVVCICFLVALVPGGMSQGSTSSVLAGIMTKFVIGLFVMGTGSSYRFIIDVLKQQRVQQENMANELAFLRSQVSPHFMFNTLNSMVSLARKKSDKLEPALMKMSGVMHYMLYDSDEEKVSLQKEVEYIQGYIDLQTMRFGDSVQILFMVNQSEKNHCIEPMLLIPLIENAFKHGTDITRDPEINIQLTSGDEGIVLSVSNKANATSNGLERKKGIGLTNLRKRLKILYPGNHDLSIEQKENWFTATLKINFNHAKVPGRRR